MFKVLRFLLYTSICMVLLIAFGGCYRNQCLKDPIVSIVESEPLVVPSEQQQREYLLQSGDTLELKFFYEPELKEAEYKLQPRDQFEIRFFRNPELDQEVTIRPDGKVELPLVGELQVAGIEPGEVKSMILSKYKTLLKDPEITMNITGFMGQKENRRTALSLSGTETYTIRPDGKISMQLIGELQAEGRTTSDLREEIVNKYTPLLEYPDATLTVTGFGIQKLYVGGEVIVPGVIPLNKFGDTTILQAIFHSGGFRETASPCSVLVISRPTATTGATVKKINLTPILLGEQPEQDVILKPFDIVYVPKTPIAEANKFVLQHIRQLLPLDLQGAFTYGVIH